MMRTLLKRWKFRCQNKISDLKQAVPTFYITDVDVITDEITQQVHETVVLKNFDNPRSKGRKV